MTDTRNTVLTQLSQNHENQTHFKTASQDSGLSRKRRFLTVVSLTTQERDIKPISQLKNRAIGRKNSYNPTCQKGINLKIRRGNNREPLTERQSHLSYRKPPLMNFQDESQSKGHLSNLSSNKCKEPSTPINRLLSDSSLKQNFPF